MKNWIDDLEELLIEKLNPSKLIIEDHTKKHLTHKGHDPSKNHVKIHIESPLFNEKTQIEQHRMVYDLLKPHFKKTLHSVSLVTHPNHN